MAAGSLIPADGIVLGSKDFYVNQSALTGETFPVQKQPGVVSATASLTERTNAVFMLSFTHKFVAGHQPLQNMTGISEMPVMLKP